MLSVVDVLKEKAKKQNRTVITLHTNSFSLNFVVAVATGLNKEIKNEYVL